LLFKLHLIDEEECVVEPQVHILRELLDAVLVHLVDELHHHEIPFIVVAAFDPDLIDELFLPSQHAICSSASRSMDFQEPSNHQPRASITLLLGQK
jgi:hypothetical protein